MKLKKLYCEYVGHAPRVSTFTQHCTGEDEDGRYKYGLLQQTCPRCLDVIGAASKEYL